MQFVSDLHLHSKYSRAVSQDMTLPTLARMAALKGLDILSVPDFTHPLWFKEVQGQLVEAGEGVYQLKSQVPNPKTQKKTNFIFSTEIASIYKDKDKLRRIHNLVFAPDMATAQKITKALLDRGCNLMSDGRPIIGLSSKALLELVMSVDDRAFLIPCHVWTPHFGMYGSASGYDSLTESFDDLAKYIYGIETGLSSDPEMNWQMPDLVNRSILSFSDAHSPLKMGREATVFELPEPTFAMIKKAIMYPTLRGFQAKSITGSTRTTSTTSKNEIKKSSRDTSGTRDTRGTPHIVYTLEFYPEEGKYHYSGHRKCNVIRGPEEIARDGLTCSVCKRRLTEGVMHRVRTLAGNYEETADAKENDYGVKWFTDKKKKHPPYVKLVPLLEIVAESVGMTVASKKVKALYYRLCENVGDELTILLKTPIEDIAREDQRVAEGVSKVRQGAIRITPGYDNVYGIVKIWGEEEVKPPKNKDADESQLALI